MIAPVSSWLKSCPCETSRLPLILCCGKPSAKRKPPRGITIVRNHISTNQCDSLTAYLRAQESKSLGVMDVGKSNKDSVAIKTSGGRVVSSIDTSEIEEELDNLVSSLCEDIIPTHYSGQVNWFEKPMVLSYETGGRYAKHADSEHCLGQERLWKRVLDRDVSVIMYLNDDFQGGQLDFHFFGYRYTPKMGDAILFPSDHRYVHEAKKVMQGHRMAIVSWLALCGTPRVMDAPPNHSRVLTE